MGAVPMHGRIRWKLYCPRLLQMATPCNIKLLATALLPLLSLIWDYHQAFQIRLHQLWRMKFPE
jgi:hypothetical protein